MRILKTNGIKEATDNSRASQLEQLAANMDYIAMMADIDIPTEDETIDGMEGTDNE